MDENLKNLIVEIFVPTGDFQGKKGVFATGYPVAKDLILTARHALCPPDRDPDHSIEIRWRHPEVDRSCWLPVEPEIVWEGGEDLDVALIRSRFPEPVQGWGYLSAEKPADRMNWTSAGFAKAGGKDDGARRPVHMQGKVFSAADIEPCFQLGADFPADCEDGWKGASGSPVFVDRRIIGVIVSCPENFNAARLHATPVWKLLQDPEFGRAVGYDDQRERRCEFADKLSRVLFRSRPAMQALDRQLEKTGKVAPTSARSDHRSNHQETPVAPTVDSVLARFGRLNPRDQLDRIMVNLEMPAQFRPSRELRQDKREIEVIEWAKREGDLKRLDDILRKLISAERSHGRTSHQSPSDHREWANYLAERLLELDVPRAIDAVKQAHWSLRDSGQSADSVVICEALQLILPAIYDHGVVEAIRIRKIDVAAALIELPVGKIDIGTALIELPVGIRTVAEIVMAGVDRRGTRFRLRGVDEIFPEGALALPLPPESGIDEDGSAFEAAWHEHAINKFRPDSLSAFRDAWHDYMTRQFAKQARTRDLKQLIQLAADELQYLADEGKTHYLLIDAPKDAEDRQALERQIQELKEQYPAVMFLNLSDDWQLERSERRRYRPVCDLLADKSEEIQ